MTFLKYLFSLYDRWSNKLSNVFIAFSWHVCFGHWAECGSVFLSIKQKLAFLKIFYQINWKNHRPTNWLSKESLVAALDWTLHSTLSEVSMSIKQTWCAQFLYRLSWQLISYDEGQNRAYSWFASQKQFLMDLLPWHFLCLSRLFFLFLNTLCDSFCAAFPEFCSFLFSFAFSPSALSPSHTLKPLLLEIQALPGKYPVCIPSTVMWLHLFCVCMFACVRAQMCKYFCLYAWLCDYLVFILI